MGTKITDATLTYTSNDLSSSPSSISIPAGKIGNNSSIQIPIDELTDYIKSEVGEGTIPLTTKGDILGFSTSIKRFPITPTDGLTIVSNSSSAFGFEWSTITGSGDVIGPSSAIDSNVVSFNSTTGKVLKDSGISTTSVNTAISHAALTSGNPHVVTHTNVGSSVAQWNASKLQGRTISAVSPSEGDILVYRSASNTFVLETKPASGTNPALADISDISFTSLSDNQVLSYDSGSNKWVNSTAGLMTTISVIGNNGISQSVSNPTTTPIITLGLGNITPSTVNGLTLTSKSVGFTIAGGTTSKTLTVSNTASISGTNTGDQTYIANITVASESSDATCFPLFVTATTGTSLPPKTNSNFIFNSATSTLGVSSLVATGEVTAYSTSDPLLKTDILLLENATSIISKFNPITFKWNDIAKSLNSTKDDRLNYGLNAEELYITNPELVHTIYSKYKGIDYEQIISILIKGNKELVERIDKLESI